jgi:hypothetical protein
VYARIEEAAVVDGPPGAQEAPRRALQDVVLGVVPEAAEWHPRLDRLGLGGDQCVDAAPLESTSTSRRPSALTPTAMMTATETMRPAWRTFR